MGICLPVIVQAKQILRQSFSRNQADTARDIPKGHFAVYVGGQHKTRVVVPIAYLNHPLFQTLLNRVEEEFGFHHQMGGLTIPCKEAFLNLTSSLNGS